MGDNDAHGFSLDIQIDVDRATRLPAAKTEIYPVDAQDLAAGE